jgi:hypothetical protein
MNAAFIYYKKRKLFKEVFSTVGSLSKQVDSEKIPLDEPIVEQ